MSREDGRRGGWAGLSLTTTGMGEPMQTCPICSSDDLDGNRQTDGTILVRCGACQHTWTRGEPRRAPVRVDTLEAARKRFPSAGDVTPARLERVEAMKREFLARRPQPDPEVAPYWERYQQVFSAEGLRSCRPQDLKDFANTPTGARPGNMSVFNDEWNALGTEAAAARTRDAIEYLLRGPADRPLEERLTDLIDERDGRGMKGFKESLLTKVLCVMQPDRFVPILTYSTEAGGKREIAKWFYDLALPDQNRVQWTIGRLIIWSNDLLLSLVGDGFSHTQLIAQFFWDTKTHRFEELTAPL
jgi:hypothetical protein